MFVKVVVNVLVNCHYQSGPLRRWNWKRRWGRASPSQVGICSSRTRRRRAEASTSSMAVTSSEVGAAFWWQIEILWKGWESWSYCYKRLGILILLLQKVGNLDPIATKVWESGSNCYKRLGARRRFVQLPQSVSSQHTPQRWSEYEITESVEADTKFLLSRQGTTYTTVTWTTRWRRQGQCSRQPTGRRPPPPLSLSLDNCSLSRGTHNHALLVVFFFYIFFHTFTIFQIFTKHIRTPLGDDCVSPVELRQKNRRENVLSLTSDLTSRWFDYVCLSHLGPHLKHHLGRLRVHLGRRRDGQLCVLQRGGGGRRDHRLPSEDSRRGQKTKPWWDSVSFLHIAWLLTTRWSRIKQETAEPCSEPRPQPHAYWVGDPLCRQRLIIKAINWSSRIDHIGDRLIIWMIDWSSRRKSFWQAQ